MPADSANMLNLEQVAMELSRRLIGLIEPDAAGATLFHEISLVTPARDSAPAIRQDGWMALVAHLILRIHRHEGQFRPLACNIRTTARPTHNPPMPPMT